MLKRKITYVNPFTEEPVTEEHYFHISKAQLVDLQMEYLNEPPATDPATGNKLEGYAARLQHVVDNQDGPGVVEVLKDFIRRSYGKKDGERFIRSEKISEEFESTEAFSQLYFEICTDAEAQAEFINSILPGGLQDEVNKIVAAQAAQAEKTGHPSDTAAQTAPVASTSPSNSSSEEQRAQATPENPYILSKEEVQAMDFPELQSGLADGRYKLS